MTLDKGQLRKDAFNFLHLKLTKPANHRNFQSIHRIDIVVKLASFTLKPHALLLTRYAKKHPYTVLFDVTRLENN